MSSMLTASLAAPLSSGMWGRLIASARGLLQGAVAHSRVPGDQQQQLADEAAGPVFDLAPELLELVFAHLLSVSSHDVLRSAAAVCTTWRDAAYSPQLWKQRLDPQVLATAAAWSPRARAGNNHQPVASVITQQQQQQPPIGLSVLPRLVLALHGRNLLRNPGFSKTLNMLNTPALVRWRRESWVITASGGDGVAWEGAPVGGPHDKLAEPLPYPGGKMRRRIAGLLGGEAPGCIATSHNWAEVVQVVPLVEELMRRGMSEAEAEALLDSGLLLGLSIMLGSRSDCGGQATVTVMLDECGGDEDTLPIQRFVAAPQRHHYYSGKLHVLQAPNTWHRFAHCVEVPRGCRRAIVVLRGKDHRIWAGHYGAKFAKAELTFVPHAQREHFGQAESDAYWSQCRLAPAVTR